MALPTIPEYITVHLGVPSDSSAPNVQVPFIDYIKNVASSEIYPTWPESALRANILAIISFALNRVYTEHYRSRGYDFDITSTTQFDQKYIPNREYFDTISSIVEDVFNDYVVREGSVQPLFTQYCNGTTVTCEGLSQWGTVTLAEQGLVPYEILQNYYGNDIGIVYNAPTGVNLPSYPGTPLRLGTAGEDVRTIQRQLNRIALNYPAIGPALDVDGIYGKETEQAVKNFQNIFNLTVDGITGKATWYKIKSVYNGVKGLSELVSEGLTLGEVERLFPRTLNPGDVGLYVRLLQYYLAVVGYFNSNLPVIDVNGRYDEQTEAAVRAFQTLQGLPVDGIVGRETWDELQRFYQETRNSLGLENRAAKELFPGLLLGPGQSGQDVRNLQEFINRATIVNPNIPKVQVTGTYDTATTAAVEAVQNAYGLPVNGFTGPLTWGVIVYLANQAPA